MLEVNSRRVVESAKPVAADLCALLRFVNSRGLVDTDFGTAMPPVAVWRCGWLSSTLNTTQVDALLGSCDRSTSCGRRDYAVCPFLALWGSRKGHPGVGQR
jgi:hypothetical protein